MTRILFVCFGLIIPQTVVGQTISVDVWTLTQPGTPPQPSNAATVRISTAANVPPGQPVQPQQPTAGGPMQNQYLLEASQLGSLVDITCRQTGHHPWTARDLYVGSGLDQNINVQLFKYDYPIKAPQCFALKTEYELLFRKEQRLWPYADRKEIQHHARVKYAGGILTLPNWSRKHVQSAENRQMLEEMTDDDRRELSEMLNGLFNLYDMDGYVRYTPSVWQTSYVAVNGQTVNSEVRLFGNHGTYSTPNGKHLLENVDIFTEEHDDGSGTDVITGNWRFAPGSPNESSGPFQWKVDGSENHFEGHFQRIGDDNKWSWTGDRVEQPLQDESDFGASDIGQPAPVPFGDAAPAPAPRIPRQRFPAPRIPAPAPPAPAPPAPEIQQ